MLKKSFLASLLAISVLSEAYAEVSIKNIKSVPPSPRTVARGQSNGLNLPPEKKQEVERITNDFNNKLTQFRPQIKEKNKALKTELAKDNPDYSTLEALNKELFDLKEQEQLVRIQYQVELAKILTPSQRKGLSKVAKMSTQEAQEGRYSQRNR